MEIYAIIWSVFKVFLSILGISVLLTSLIGGISVVKVFGTAGNLMVEPDDVDVSFGAAGNHILIQMDFNNTGYFPFEDFTVTTVCIFQNKSSGETYTLLDQPLFQDTLEGREFYSVFLEANNSDFEPANLLSDNQESWHDPDIQNYIDNGTVTENEVLPLSYPFLLWHYDISFELQIHTTYNLGLLEFALDVKFDIEYGQYFSTAYPTLKANVIGGF